LPAPSTPYKPLPGTLAERVCQFFLRHPEEELSTRDIAQKFDVPVGSVRNGLEACLTHKLLKFSGSNFLSGEALRAPPPTAAAAPPRRAPRQRLPHLDPASITVRDDVPVPVATRGPGGETKYGPSLDRLVKVGQSFLLPIEYRPAIAKAIKDHGKRTGRTFSIRTVDPQHVGVWRVK
jgi:hypothetical protein